MPFSKQPLVAVGTFTRLYGQDAARLRFENEWRADTTVQVKRFQRTVRAGGAHEDVTVIVVRRKQ